MDEETNANAPPEVTSNAPPEVTALAVKAPVAKHHFLLMTPASVMAYCDVSTVTDPAGNHITLGILQTMNPADVAKRFNL
jgi:hypothetical protein